MRHALGKFPIFFFSLQTPSPVLTMPSSDRDRVSGARWPCKRGRRTGNVESWKSSERRSCKPGRLGWMMRRSPSGASALVWRTHDVSGRAQLAGCVQICLLCRSGSYCLSQAAMRVHSTVHSYLDTWPPEVPEGPRPANRPVPCAPASPSVPGYTPETTS